MSKIVKFSQNLDYYLRLIDARMSSSDFLGALDAARRAVEHARTRVDCESINILIGQIYFESGQIHNARLAYQKAHDLLPNSPAFQLNLAQAMLEDSPSPKEIETIISLLNKSLVKSKNAYAWLMLAQAYGMQDNMAYANYASAEFSLFIGEVETAQKQVSEAKKLNPPSALQNKLSDIEKRIEQILKKRNSF